MHFHLITLFPDAFESYLRESIIGRAIRDGRISVSYYNPREYTTDKHRSVDDKPYGGGPGMVMQAEPVIKAIASAKGRKKKVRIILTSARGEQFSNQYAAKLASEAKHVIIVCGRYEGIDARVREVFAMDEISIGPYVLTGGELPAMVMMDTISRQVPGVLGDPDSLEESRAASGAVYTRPEQFRYKGKEYRVPEVLRSGDHKEIEEWRRRLGARKLGG